MTLDEAIKHLEETLSDKSHKWSCESCKQEHEQLLEWLKELKALKEKSQVDLISRKYLKEQIPELLSHDDGIDIWIKRFDVERLIDNAPTTPLPAFKEGYKQAIIDGKTNFSKPQGEWIEDNGDLRCPFCKVLRDSIHGSFCPNCGADMRKGGAV